MMKSAENLARDPRLYLTEKKSTAKTFTERFFGLNYGRIPQT